MRVFLRRGFLFILPVVLILVIICGQYRIIPFAGSISFDSKIYDLCLRDFDTIDNISIGSSITLNNLNSQVLSSFLNEESYYNVSSWGQNIEEDLSMLNILVPIYHPHRIFIVTCCEDFEGHNLDISNDISMYLRYPKASFLPLMAMYKIKRRFLNFEDNYEKSKVDTCSYSCLDFDECGGVPLNVYGENISESRWNHLSSFSFNLEDNNSYIALESICSYLMDEGISFVFVNSPARSTYYSNVLEDVQNHIEYTDSIVTRYGGVFIDELDYVEYSDSLFCDSHHLNRHGAEHLTRNICRHLSDDMK